MKTFTVTLHHTNNYGAILQAYALQTAIKGYGYENTIFEYPYKEKKYSKINIKKPKSAVRSMYVNMSAFIHRKPIAVREESFRRFHREKMNVSRIYTSMDDLRNDDIDADILISGSDQVWRFAGNTEFMPAKFLDFGKKGVKKFSYAASIEQLEYTEQQKEKVKEWLKDYVGISLREKSAADYIKSVTGYETVRVVDPVFLLKKEKWLEIAEPRRIKEPYILCYQVQSSPRMQEVTDYLKKKTGYRTVSVIPYSTSWIKTDETLYDVTPGEFVSLCSGAQIVVSEAFHGAAMGLVFDKPVYSIARGGSASRLGDMTRLFGIENYLITSKSTIPDPSEYDTEAVKKRKDEEREKSLEYLASCLGSGK